MRKLALLKRLNSTLRTGLLAGAIVMAGPGHGQDAPDLDRIMSRAEAGDVEAQNALGNVYANGAAGVAQDLAEALKWYRRAADRGFAPAQFNVGLAYELGRGVAADARQAFTHYLRAAEQGFAPAQFNVGNMYSSGRGVGQDYFEANLWFKQAADSGLVEAQFNLGYAYEAGNGVKKDEAQAARWYRQAAERGYARGQYNLGLLLEDGRGVNRDLVAAATLYRAAAEQNFPPAQVNYGLMLSEGRPGLAADPVQAYVWLSRAAQNGAGSEARDALARNLNPEQLAAANRLLGGSGAGPVAAAARIETPAARNENAGNGNLVEQLREQSRRLAARVESLTADKESAERQVAVLGAQIRDLQDEIQRARATGGTSATAPSLADTRLQSELASLTTRLEQAAAALREAEQTNTRLADANRQLQQEKAELTARTEGPGGPDSPQQATIIANLQRDNARLNDEVKSSVRELLSLNSQLRALRAQSEIPPAAAAGGDNTAQVETLAAETRAAREQAARLEADNRRLAARVNELESAPRPAQADPATAPLQQQVKVLLTEKADLEQWSQSLEKTLEEKSGVTVALEQSVADLRQRQNRLEQDLAQRSQSLEQQGAAATRLARENEELTGRLARAEQQLKTATEAKPDNAETGRLRQQLETATRELAEVRQAREQSEAGLTQAQADLAEAGRTAAQLKVRVDELAAARAALQEQLAQAQDDSTNVAALRDSLVRANAQVTDLQRELAVARQQDEASGAGTAGLQRQLAEANQALEKSGTTVAELTEANDRLGRELADAKRGSAEAVALRDELAGLRQGAAETVRLREENDRLKQEVGAAVASLRAREKELVADSQKLSSAVDSGRRELTRAQDRVAELEKQLADALTVRTRGGDESRRIQGELAEANQTVDKLNTTVAELTAENQKLEQDLDNAQKATAAALAAQSQAVNAASPDAFRMEISTLQARVRELEAQAEEERTNAAREITTLASQLQLTRESNRSLTEANRALLSAKDSESASVRDEQARLAARVRELDTLNEELRRQGQQQAAEVRSLAVERDSLRSQLTDARQVATVLPGLTDEKAALQERLEAVGGQLVQLQREHDDLQTNHAALTQQLTSTRQTAEKAEADFAALQARVAEAEKADEAHTASVAEITQANVRLEQEREDMRRLVESYRADIARLNQAVRAAEQQRTAAEEGGQQNVDALTAQMAQLRREIEASRANQARLAEAYATQERDRAATITQLRTENSALAARLNQAQGTLDQIAAAARLGTPAATIASGGTPPARPAPVPAAEARYHTVIEGDSLSRISLRYYGTPNRWQEIFQANRDVLQGSNALRIGMQLRIP